MGICIGFIRGGLSRWYIGFIWAQTLNPPFCRSCILPFSAVCRGCPAERRSERVCDSHAAIAGAWYELSRLP